VVVGYREAGSKQTLIVYDPYGKWLGPGGTFNYDKNSTDQNSRKGQWAYYDYDQIWGYGNSTYTGRIMTVHQIGQLYNGYTVSSDARGPADAISVEPENLVTYSGMKIMEGDRVYLPLVITDGAD
jgi:hypothetical protein